MDAVRASYITHKRSEQSRAISRVAHSIITQRELIKSGIKGLDGTSPR